MCDCTDCQEDRREAYKASMMRDERACTMCGDYAQADGLCNECFDYCAGRLLDGQTPIEMETDNVAAY